LPAIFNPEDMNALEQAIRIKESVEGAEIILLTMGPPRAANIIRESLYRGIDKGYLITDRRFAGSDTLATSYAISLAIKKLEPFNIVISGRQAIDGDTAQVGPQTAEKLNIPQITYAEKILNVNNKQITVKRRLERGIEIVTSTMPVLITVNSSAPKCRARNSKLVMKFKHSNTDSELQNKTISYTELYDKRPYLKIKEWSVDDLNTNPERLGLSGSPTKVKKIENVVLQQKQSKALSDNNNDIQELMKELINSHIIG
jgi:electron transfer flavoprotein beta subunit